MRSLLYQGQVFKCIGVDEVDYLVLNERSPLLNVWFILPYDFMLDQNEGWESFVPLDNYIGSKVTWISKSDAEILEEKPLYGIYD